jgi:hypothetical protein
MEANASVSISHFHLCNKFLFNIQKGEGYYCPSNVFNNPTKNSFLYTGMYDQNNVDTGQVVSVNVIFIMNHRSGFKAFYLHLHTHLSDDMNYR